MDLPIYDIWNDECKDLWFHVINNCNGHNICKNIEHIYGKNGHNKLYTRNIERVDIVHCSHPRIAEIYKEYYNDEYIDRHYGNNVALVMQKNKPLSIFVTEDKWTYIFESRNLILTSNNINLLNQKIIKYSQFHNNTGYLCVYLNKMLTKINNYNYLYWFIQNLSDTLLFDIKNVVVDNLIFVMHKKFQLKLDKLGDIIDVD